MRRLALLLILLCGCNGTPEPTWPLPPPVDPSPTQPPSPTPEYRATLDALDARIEHVQETALPAIATAISVIATVYAPSLQNTPQVQATLTVVAIMQGKATYYSRPYIGRIMRNGEVYTGKEMTLRN